MGSLRILVVEDEPDFRALLEQLLRMHGFDVVSVSSFEKGIEQLASTTFALVLANCAPGQFSPSEHEAMPLLEAASPIPVGSISAWSQLTEVVTSRLAFALAKPSQLEDLLACIAETVTIANRPREDECIEAYFAALGAGNWNGVAELCSEAVEYVFPGQDAEFSNVIAGRAHFRAFTEQTFEKYPGARFQVKTLQALPRGTIAHYQGSWQRPDGSAATVDGAVVFDFEGDHIGRIGIRIERDKLGLAVGTR